MFLLICSLNEGWMLTIDYLICPGDDIRIAIPTE